VKIWFVDTPFLSDALLTRQHQGLHALIHGVIKGKPRRGVTRYLRYAGFLACAHFWTVMEMQSRGFQHNTPFHDLYRQVPMERRKIAYPGLTPETVLRDRAVIVAKMAKQSGHESQFRSTIPVHLAKFELIDKVNAVVRAGELPKFCLIL
jgi:hypothetical protein